MHARPDRVAGGGDVGDLPAARVDARVDAPQERDEGGTGGLPVPRITQVERRESRPEHHRVQVGFAQSEAAVVPEVGHPVGDGVVGDRAPVELGGKAVEPPAHHLAGQLVHPAHVAVGQDHRLERPNRPKRHQHGEMVVGEDDPFACLLLELQVVAEEA